MLRTLAILLALTLTGPLACDDAGPDETTDETTTDATTTGDDETTDAPTTGAAIEPTPVPFKPPLREQCGRPRIKDCVR